MNRETFSPKLDEISENIIYLLSLDSRISISGIARILHINRKIIENRINQLYNKGFIKPLLIYNYSGLIKTTVLIKLTGFDGQIIEKIKGIDPIIKFKETLGLYDLSLLLVTESQKELDAILHNINKSFHNTIQNIDLVTHPMEDTMGYKSFCHKLELMQRYNMLNPDMKYNLSDEERQLVGILKVNPHISYKELIKRTRWSYLKIKDTIARLQNKQIIRFSIDPDYNKLQLEFHNILAKINLAKAKQFEATIIKNPRVHWIKKGTGRWDYILSVGSRDMNEFIEITRDIRTANKNIIFDYSSLVSKINVMRKV